MRIPPTIRTSRQLPGATWAVIAVLALAACSPSASPSESVTVGGDTTVTISGRSFGGDITIAAGSTVAFVNNDGFGHTVTNGENGVAAADALFDEPLAAGGTFVFTFDTSGVHLVTCRIHPSMNLTITVQ